MHLRGLAHFLLVQKLVNHKKCVVQSQSFLTFHSCTFNTWHYVLSVNTIAKFVVFGWNGIGVSFDKSNKLLHFKYII